MKRIIALISVTFKIFIITHANVNNAMDVTPYSRRLLAEEATDGTEPFHPSTALVDDINTTNVLKVRTADASKMDIWICPSFHGFRYQKDDGRVGYIDYDTIQDLKLTTNDDGTKVLTVNQNGNIQTEFIATDKEQAAKWFNNIETRRCIAIALQQTIINKPKEEFIQDEDALYYHKSGDIADSFIPFGDIKNLFTVPSEWDLNKNTITVQTNDARCICLNCGDEDRNSVIMKIKEQIKKSHQNKEENNAAGIGRRLLSSVSSRNSMQSISHNSPNFRRSNLRVSFQSSPPPSYTSYQIMDELTVVNNDAIIHKNPLTKVENIIYMNNIKQASYNHNQQNEEIINIKLTNGTITKFKLSNNLILSARSVVSKINAIKQNHDALKLNLHRALPSMHRYYHWAYSM